MFINSMLVIITMVVVGFVTAITAMKSPGLCPPPLPSPLSKSWRNALRYPKTHNRTPKRNTFYHKST